MKEKPDTPAPAALAAPPPMPTLLYVRKGKNNGRVGRPKKLKNIQQPSQSPSSLVMSRRRGSGESTDSCSSSDGVNLNFPD